VIVRHSDAGRRLMQGVHSPKHIKNSEQKRASA
jgi:hypothetical protein